jgi:hypothetical protein
MRFVVRRLNTKNSELFATKHRHQLCYEAKSGPPLAETDFEVVGCRYRLSL